MKKLLLKAGLTVAVAAISFAATAQTTSKSSWMLENNVYGHRYNAAYIPEKSYFGIGVGSVNPAIYSDIGVANILFPTETGLVSGFNDAVSTEQFLSGMNALNRIQVDLNENILSIGARGKKGGYSVFELNARVNVKNIENGTVFTETYDKLILSPGAKPIKPNFEGIDSDKIFTLRTVEDTLKIKKFINEKYPKEFVIRDNSGDGVMEEVEEKPDEYDSN